MSNNDRATSLTKLVEQRKPASGRRKPDRRIERTRNRLGNALIALIQEKPIDEVAVREVLHRAGVGRSTFYVHYRDKDDLFLSELEQGLEMWTTTLSRQQAISNRVAPVAEFFAHVASAKRLYRALVNSGLAGSKHSSSLRKATSRAGSNNVSSNQQTSATRINTN
ncbi:MAG: TetR/AcrR family transcriptional regulator [Acidobacteriia bacterium]|nr:TetR/AcrR family transcriptional regulator [Terriglobia bacterium]